MKNRTTWPWGGALVLLLAGCSNAETEKVEEPTATARTVQQGLTTSPDSDCDLHTRDGRDYWFCHNHRTWSEAKSNCEAVGLRLVWIDDATENSFVDAHAAGDTWIGATDAAAEGEWLWTDGAQFWSGDDNGNAVGGLFSAWDAGEPDISNQDCAQITGDKWHDDSCGDHEEYVCEEAGPDDCPDDPLKTQPGICNCGTPDVDSDGDGAMDCVDQCPNDAIKTAPGDCGCGDAPEPIGTACDDGLCDANTQCDGAGTCGNPQDCAPDTDCTLRTFDRGTYWFCKNHRSWSDAEARCDSVGLDLVRIDSEAENSFIDENALGDWWIGATDATTEGTWTWDGGGDTFWIGDDDGASVDSLYNAWGAGEPDTSSGQNCAQISGEHWRDDSCSDSEQYVCERVAPEPFVNCVSEVAPEAFAVLFGYENLIGREIEIPRGPQNFLTPPAEGPESEPLTQFLPGRVDRGFWALMTSAELSWTLRGRTVTATPDSPGCGAQAYPPHSGRVDQGERPSPPLSRTEKLIPYFKDPAYDPDAVASPSGAGDAGAIGTIQQPLTSLQAPFQVDLVRVAPGHNLGLGDCDEPYYEARVTIAGERCGFEWVAGDDQVCAPHPKCGIGCCGVCSAAVSVDVSYSCSKDADVTVSTVPVRIELREVDDLTGNETLVDIELEIDNSSGDVLSVAGGTIIDPDLVKATGSGWLIELDVTPSGPPAAVPPARICPQWNTDYVDEGFGETVTGERTTLAEPARYPASFAKFELSVQGPLATHTDSGFLDADGCVTLDADAALALVHLEGAGSDPEQGGLALELELFTDLERPDGAGYAVTEFDIRLGTQVSEVFGVSTATPGVVPLDTWATDRVWAIAPADIPLSLRDLGSGYTITPRMNIAATMGRILAAEDIALTTTVKPAIRATQPGEGCEIGGNVDSCVSGGTLFIGPSSRPPSPGSCAIDADCPSVQQCFSTRPAGDLFTDTLCPGPGSSCECRWPDQARWKFTIAHEAGHQVQGGTTGSFNQTDYTFDCPPGTTCSGRVSGLHAGELLDPPFVDQFGFCGCQHVGAANAEHCLQSVERGGDAQGEGIAQYFASRIWNQRSAPEPRFVYYKEFFGETCLGRNPADCSPATISRSTGITTFPPFGISCDEPFKWRNRHCSISEAAEFGTELDWMTFLYSLNDTGSLVSPMADIWAIYRHTCNPPPAGSRPSPTPGLCTDSVNVAWTSRPPVVDVAGSARACADTSDCLRGEQCFDGALGSASPCSPASISCVCKLEAVEGFADGATRLYGPDGPQVDPDRLERVRTFGFDYGVSTDLNP